MADGTRAGTRTVRAAGCVLWRRTPREGQHTEPVEIALVHRPKYDDWSHPKGKLKRGEDPLRGALREVYEETGYDCEPGARLPTAHYLANGRPKEVSYWAAEATGGAFVPNREVDWLVWLPPSAARLRLTHERDRALVDDLLHALHLHAS
ncbi:MULTISPECIES: NUDIX hydrolase [unclassified Streptomyces]|uniref:NUDIX hydrolase n=1 Tax=unclassified Streptomyces TaxID=2593676 RepID=UPI003FD585BC